LSHNAADFADMSPSSSSAPGDDAHNVMALSTPQIVATLKRGGRRRNLERRAAEILAAGPAMSSILSVRLIR
jgi:hypothetical protein